MQARAQAPAAETGRDRLRVDRCEVPHPLFTATDSQATPSLFLQTPAPLGGACARTGLGPYAAWMPQKSLHGRTCGVSHAGTRASAPQRPKHSPDTADVMITFGRCAAADRQATPSLFQQTPTPTDGACARPGVGPYAAWMPHKSLHGRTCGVSHAGMRASALSDRSISPDTADVTIKFGRRGRRSAGNAFAFSADTPTPIGGACARAGVGPYAARMPHKSLHGRTCGVSHAGTRADAPQ
ncbi:Hypothetical Protein CFBP6762_03762 [Xanthomonas arboricola pv. fragariae]|nr:Hypothetical Protein CFBP6762_03762 [Xanthomonas arboricola pv. fragariae]